MKSGNEMIKGKENKKKEIKEEKRKKIRRLLPRMTFLQHNRKN